MPDFEVNFLKDFETNFLTGTWLGDQIYVGYDSCNHVINPFYKKFKKKHVSKVTRQNRESLSSKSDNCLKQSCDGI